MTNTKLHGYERVSADRYFTLEANRLIPALCRHVGISGKVHEPAAGAGHMSDELRRINGVTEVIETDIAPDWSAPSVTQMPIEALDGSINPDWVVTNLPFADQDRLMTHLLAIYPYARHAYLVRAAYLAPAKREGLIHTNPRFAGSIVISKRPRWIENSKGSPAVDYCFVVFGGQGFSAAPKLAFENGPAVDFWGDV